jgi:hypothetical protein
VTQRRLVSTASEGLRPLGPPELRSFELITELIADAEELTPAHAALFAEPVRSPFGDRSEWYTSLDGPVTRLVDLPEEAAAQARSRVAELSAGIREYAEKLMGSGSDNDARIAEALLNALQVPGEDSILIIDQPDAPGGIQPVLIDWASVPDRQTSVPNVLTSFAAPKAPPAPAARPEAATAGAPMTGAGTASDNGFWWLMPGLLTLVALLMALILYLLFVSCGLRHVPFLNFCPVASDVEDPSRGTAMLQNRVLMLERELFAAERSCQPAATQRQVGLTWAGRADLDLSLICPDGSKVWFRDKVQASCGASLEFDENHSTRATSPRTTERILLEDPPEGRYTIRVELFENWTEPGEHPFDLNINFDGRPEGFSGSVSTETRVWEREYEFSR